jgi:predicted MFS family arabinose efflux permease
MYLDLQAPAHRRASTQAIWIVLVTGLGSLLGSVLAGELLVRSGGVGPMVFLVPGLIDLAALVAVLAVFHPVPAPVEPVAEAPAPAPQSPPGALAFGRLNPAPSGKG